MQYAPTIPPYGRKNHIVLNLDNHLVGAYCIRPSPKYLKIMSRVLKSTIEISQPCFHQKDLSILDYHQ